MLPSTLHHQHTVPQQQYIPHGGQAHLDRRQVRCRAGPSPTETLKGPELESWQAAQQHVEQLGPGIEPSKAELYLKKAFAWTKGYWDAGEKPLPQVPSLEQVSTATSFLQEKGAMSNEELAAAVAKFPQVLGLTELQLNGAINVMEKAQFVKGKAREAKLKRNPDALGRNWDCGGECEGHCARCWVNF